MKHASLMRRLVALEDRKLALEEKRDFEYDSYWDRAIGVLATAEEIERINRIAEVVAEGGSISPEDDAWHEELMGHIGNEIDFLTETGKAMLFDLNPVSGRKDFPADERRWTYLQVASQTRPEQV